MSENMKKITHFISKGGVCYLIMLMIGSMAVEALFMVAEERAPGSISSDDPLASGLSLLAGVLVGLLALRRFAEKHKKRGEIFTEEESVRSSLFQGGRRMGAGRLLVYAFITLAAALLADRCYAVLELALNCAGLTAQAGMDSLGELKTGYLLIFYTVIVGPVAEELVFRGFIMKGLRPYGKVFAIVVSAVMFALMHGNIAQIFATIWAGLLLGYVAMEYSLYASMVLHIINNGLYSTGFSMLEEQNPAVFNIVFPVCGAAAVLVTILWLIRYGRKLPEYFRENRTVKGAAGTLRNRWFILYALLLGAQTVVSVKAL